MNFKHTLLLFVATTLIAACAGGTPTPQDAEPSVTADAGSPDGSTPLEASEDAGEDDGTDAGPSDAGPADAGCPTFYVPSPSGCQAAITVDLTADGANVVGDTVYVGTGTQPDFHVQLQAPPGAGTPTVTLEVVQPLPDGGQFTVGEATLSPSTVDGGTTYDKTAETRVWPEARYVVEASATFGDAGFMSKPLQLVVDRTPPHVALSLDLDGGVQPRDFWAVATATADDGDGAGPQTIAISGGGPQWTAAVLGTPAIRKPAWTPFANQSSSLMGTTFNATAAVDGRFIAYDAWSTAKDGDAIDIQAQATDLAGNVGVVDVAVPITRALWTGPYLVPTQPALTGTGQIVVANNPGITNVMPDGTSGGQLLLPEGMSGPGPVIVLPQDNSATYMLARAGQSLEGESVLVGMTEGLVSGNVGLPGTGGLVMSQAQGRQTIDTLDITCQHRAFDPVTLEIVDSGPLGASCYGSGLIEGLGPSMILETPEGDSVFSGAGATSASGSPFGFSAGQSASLLSSTRAILPGHTGLVVVDLDTLGQGTIASNLTGVSSVVQFGDGRMVTVSADGTGLNALTLLDAKGNTVWTKGALSAPLAGPLLGVDGTIYIVDGQAALSAIDGDSGLTRWSSPTSTYISNVAPLLDRCLYRLYLPNVIGDLSAVVVDSPGLDADPSAWPMPGHDVFQTNSGGFNYQLDCANHV